jgi:hypothetical protein
MKTKQNYEIGQTVKVGFMNLIVRANVLVRNSYANGAKKAYILSNKDNTTYYLNSPYEGCSRLEKYELDSIFKESDRLAAL